MTRTTIALAAVTLALFSACYGTSASDDDAAGGAAGTGGTNRAGSSNRGGTSTAGSSSDAGSDSGGANAGGSDSGGANAGGAGNTGAGGTPPWDVWRACTVAEDCTVIPINGCCGCSPTGVNKEYEEEALATNASFDASTCPPGLGCPSQPCPPDSMVACEADLCVPKPGCSERSEQDCDLDGLCEKYQARLCSTAGEFAYFACGKPKTGCDDALTCVVSPFGQEVLFPDSCAPDGYSQPCVSQCQ